MKTKELSDIVKVTAAILVKDEKIIIARRGPDDNLADKWEFPGGKIENDETPGQFSHSLKHADIGNKLIN